jgi:hypothetical protein
MRSTFSKLALVVSLAATTTSVTITARSAASAGPALTSIGTLAFAADGTLFASDPMAATIFAIDLGASSATAGTTDVAGLDQKIAAMAGTDAAQISIKDIAVNPKSHNTYVSVMRGQGATAQPALFRVDGAGKISLVALDGLKFTSVTLPNPPAMPATGRSNRSQSITKMSLVDGKLYITGLSNEEFASKFWAVPYPFKTADQGTSVEIWHTSHARFETNAPILTFVSKTTNGATNFIAGYTCTPLVRFPIADLKPGAKVMGTTIAELGAGNQPIDMVLYTKGGRDFVLMANTRHGVLKIAADGFGTASGLKEPVPGTASIPAEKITSVANVVQLDLLDATHSVMLMKTDAGFNLSAVILPSCLVHSRRCCSQR